MYLSIGLLIILITTAIKSSMAMHEDVKCKRGFWSGWTSWSDCKGGECHRTLGFQQILNHCRVYKNASSRGDVRGQEKIVLSTIFSASEQRQCVDNSTCVGKWKLWSEWDKCGGKKECLKFRYRDCVNPDSNEDIGYELCAGGLDAHREWNICGKPGCAKTGKNSSPRAEDVGRENENESFDKNAVIVLSVALACLFMGGCFMFAILRYLARRKPKDCYKKHKGWSVKSGRGGSLNGHSTATTVTTVTSPLPMHNQSEPNFFMPHAIPSVAISRSISVPVDNLPTTQNNSLLNIPQQSAMRDNVYWEILDVHHRIPDSPPPKKEIVHNVLYATTDVL